jgi:hypothetical protein
MTAKSPHGSRRSAKPSKSNQSGSGHRWRSSTSRSAPDSGKSTYISSGPHAASTVRCRHPQKLSRAPPGRVREKGTGPRYTGSTVPRRSTTSQWSARSSSRWVGVPRSPRRRSRTQGLPWRSIGTRSGTPRRTAVMTRSLAFIGPPPPRTAVGASTASVSYQISYRWSPAASTARLQGTAPRGALRPTAPDPPKPRRSSRRRSASRLETAPRSTTVPPRFRFADAVSCRREIDTWC